ASRCLLTFSWLVARRSLPGHLCDQQLSEQPTTNQAHSTATCRGTAASWATNEYSLANGTQGTCGSQALLPWPSIRLRRHLLWMNWVVLVAAPVRCWCLLGRTLYSRVSTYPSLAGGATNQQLQRHLVRNP